MSWLYPPALEETFRCDYCDCDFSAMQEMAEDDRAHAQMERNAGHES